MIYREYRPSPPLADLVECYWSLRGHQGPRRGGAGGHRVLPDGCMDLVFDLASGASTPRAVGAMPRARVVPHEVRVHAWGVRFRPGSAPAFVSAPAQELTGETPELACFWGPEARELGERLGEASGARGRVRVLDGCLLARRDPDALDGLVVATRASLLASCGNREIGDLAREAGLGTRQLERRVAHAVGLPPKLLARIIRFRAGVEALAREPDITKGRLALRLGYYDQAHFGRDFKELAGVSPGGYLSERRGVAFVQAGAGGEHHLGSPKNSSQGQTRR